MSKNENIVVNQKLIDKIGNITFQKPNNDYIGYTLHSSDRNIRFPLLYDGMYVAALLNKNIKNDPSNIELYNKTIAINAIIIRFSGIFEYSCDGNIYRYKKRI